MRKIATLLAATAAIATVSTTSLATASETLPPPAYSCTAEVTGFVVCEADGVVHHAPDEYLTPYAGGISLHVRNNRTGIDKKCGGSDLSNEALDFPGTGLIPGFTETPSVGPTLVMVGVGTCRWPATDQPTTYTVHMYWSTHTLSGGSLTIAEKVGSFVI